MRRKHLFALILFLEMVYIYVPEWGAVIKPFINDTEISMSAYVYFHFEHMVFIILGWLLVSDSKHPERFTNKAFFGVLVFDYADYILTCNQAWGANWMTGNLVKLAGFILLTWNTDNE